MKKISFRDPAVLIGAAGLLALIAIFVLWLVRDSDGTLYGHAAALCSAALYGAVCLRFIKPWLGFWSGKETAAQGEEPPKFITAFIFVALLALDALVIVGVIAVRMQNGFTAPMRYQLDFWRCLDSGHYLDIAREWYLSEGIIDRLVQLVFLPGYPIIIRLFSYVIPNEVVAGLVAAGLCFAGAGCMVFRLLCLDMPCRDALRTLKFLVLCPGMFFFVAPMSESLFLLCCCACLYCVRKGKWLPGCLLGAYAAFTRSLGLVMVVPVFFEAIHVYSRSGDKKRLWLHIAEMLVILCGFGAYLCVNYAVAGDFFKFLDYQANHWNQSLGWFFATADAQIEYAVSAFSERPNIFLGLWIPNLLAAFFALAVMVYGVRHMRASYGAWFIIYYAIAMGATWLLSGPRYLLVLLPITIAVGQMTKKRAANIITTVLYIFAGCGYYYAFIMRWQVW